MKTKLIRGMVAGFVATVLLTALMVAKALTGFMPELNLAALLSGVMHAPIWVGWITHFLIGTVVWGGLFAVLAPRIPGSNCTIRGAIFGLGIWVLMMVVVLPLTGMGLFGGVYGAAAPAVTLALHLVYGVVLGFTFARIHGEWHIHTPADDAKGALRYTHY